MDSETAWVRERVSPDNWTIIAYRPDWTTSVVATNLTDRQSLAQIDAHNRGQDRRA